VNCFEDFFDRLIDAVRRLLEEAKNLVGRVMFTRGRQQIVGRAREGRGPKEAGELAASSNRVVRLGRERIILGPVAVPGSGARLSAGILQTFVDGRTMLVCLLMGHDGPFSPCRFALRLALRPLGPLPVPRPNDTRSPTGIAVSRRGVDDEIGDERGVV
jgi:hypothetical protein